MNVNSKKYKKKREKIPRYRYSDKYNPLNFKLPRKYQFSGNFHLITVYFITDNSINISITN